MAEVAARLETSDDTLLGGKVLLRQPKDGYRVAIDPIFLAAAVPALPGDLVLDVGAGVGAAALCLVRREPGCNVRGIELQRDLVRLATENVIANGLNGRIDVMVGDLLHPPPRLAPGAFSHVMANPPFLPEGAATPPPQASKAQANVEGEAQLPDWVRFALTMVRPKGSVTFVHRADRLEALLAALAGKAGDIAVFPLWPGAGKPAGRVIVRARKGVASPTRLLPGLILHEADGRYTPAANAVLREGAGLIL